MDSLTADDWIELLQLSPHEEGGSFVEVYRSEEKIPGESLPDRFSSDRCFSTSIYFLLRSHECSRFHRIKADEIWHFYAGASSTIHVLFDNGMYSAYPIGQDVRNGDMPQHVVPAGSWFGATVNSQDSYALFGCTVAPGFEFADFEMGKTEQLLSSYPDQRDIIEQLT